MIDCWTLIDIDPQFLNCLQIQILIDTSQKVLFNCDGLIRFCDRNLAVMVDQKFIDYDLKSCALQIGWKIEGFYLGDWLQINQFINFGMFEAI